LEITSGHFSDNIPAAQKYYGMQRLSQYHQVCYLDADCIISSECPSPFEFAINTGMTIYVVPDVQNEAWTSGVYRDPISALEKRLSELPASLHFLGLNNLRWTGQPDNFFNSGFFVCSPKSDIFNVMILALENSIIKKPEEEQALFNILVGSGIWLKPICLPREWNWLELPLGTNPKAYIRHFAGCLVEDKKRLINEAK
jgi:lipopolysaccharide biosynthesis glycosyltransferase